MIVKKAGARDETCQCVRAPLGASNNPKYRMSKSIDGFVCVLVIPVQLLSGHRTTWPFTPRLPAVKIKRIQLIIILEIFESKRMRNNQMFTWI